MAETVRALVERGIPVMGHLGLTPQSVHALGGYRVQGREAGAADRLLDDATGAGGGGRVRHRARAGAGRAGAAGVGGAHDSHHRHRRRAPAATARCWCCTTCSASTRGSLPSSSSATPSWARRSGRRSRTYADDVRGRPLSRRRSTASSEGAGRPRLAHGRARHHSRHPRGWVRAQRRRRASHRAGAHDGLPARGPPRPGGRGAPQGRRGGHEHLRQPAAVRTHRGPRPLPARPAARPAPGGGARRGRALRAQRGGDVPDRAPRSASCPGRRRIGGKVRRGPATSPAC